MGYVNIATTTTLAKAVAKTNSNSDLLVFSNDQPHAIVREGSVIGTACKKTTSGAILSASHDVNYVEITENKNCTFDGTLEEGIAYHIVLHNPTTQSFSVNFDANNISGISTIYYGGSRYTAGNTVTISVSGYTGTILTLVVINQYMFIQN